MDEPVLTSPSPPVLYQSLDPRVAKLWRIHSLIASAVLLVVGGIAVLFLGFGNFLAWNWLIAGWLGLLLFRVFSMFWQTWVYRAWGYRLDGKVLETRHGVWFRTMQLLPLARLQHVDLHNGPIERSFGLASLMLHTAGTHEATIVIPGLNTNEAVKLRDHLVVVGGDDGV